MGISESHSDGSQARESLTVLVYEALELSSLQANERFLARLFGYGGGAASSCEFTTSDGACVYFKNRTEVYSDRVKRYLPRDRAEAIAAARGFVNAMNQEARARPTLGVPFFLSGVKDYSCQQMLHPAGDRADHWLVRFKVFLRPDRDEDQVQVLDSRLDVRIGDRGSVIEFFTNWRPIAKILKARRYIVAMPAVVPPPAQPQPQLVYLLPFGESSYVAPYFLEASRRAFVPACEYSERVWILGETVGTDEA